uniref:Uncharacterized protein n=1 Tax=Setaria viridis TaxID=4556 RepID=A0A4U6TMB6_SETVI|nr:hypothetical protein SEVIR_8G225400v2 [Setaria viridis]
MEESVYWSHAAVSQMAPNFAFFSFRGPQLSFGELSYSRLIIVFVTVGLLRSTGALLCQFIPLHQIRANQLVRLATAARLSAAAAAARNSSLPQQPASRTSASSSRCTKDMMEPYVM